MRLSIDDIAKAIKDGARTDSQGRNTSIDPINAAMHVHALLVERGLVERLSFPSDLPGRSPQSGEGQ